MRIANRLLAASIALLTLGSLGCEHRIREAADHTAPLTAIAAR